MNTKEYGDCLWQQVELQGESYQLMDLDCSAVEQEILAEMDRGVDVFYDRRWEAATVLAKWLLAHPEKMRDRQVLILGAGVGVETVVLARHARHVYLNDLAVVALDLCAQQLRFNGADNFTLLPGSYQELALPSVDWTVGSFLVYNAETLAAMSAFLEKGQGELFLVNERLKPFQQLLKKFPHELVFDEEGVVGVTFSMSG